VEPQASAKSIDAFANTEGGTLVVGMTTLGREPAELTGVEHEGELADQAVGYVVSGGV
jgi:hypothetical protein